MDGFARILKLLSILIRLAYELFILFVLFYIVFIVFTNWLAEKKKKTSAAYQKFLHD